MKLLAFLSVTFLITATLVSQTDRFNVGDVFANNIAELRHGLAPQKALANTALDDFTVKLKADEERARKRAEAAWNKKTEAAYINAGMDALMEEFPTSYACQQGKSLLAVRWSKATDYTLNDVRTWVDYVRRRHCQAIMPSLKHFTDAGLAEYRKALKAAPYSASASDSADLASSTDEK